MVGKEKKGKRKNEKRNNIQVTGSGIGDEGANAISEALEVNTTLTSLNLVSEE